MKLIAVTDDQMPIQKLIETLTAIEPYIDAVILREKTKTDRDMFQLLERLAFAGFKQEKVIVHRRADLATLATSQKVQLPEHGLPLPVLKEHFPTLTFGKSIHSYQEAVKARNEGANWVLYGHLYETDSKNNLPPRGTDELSRIIGSLAIPTFAIGGIKPNHIEDLKDLGVDGIAVMSSIFGNDNPVTASKKYYDAIHCKRGRFS